jgi:hypothetical protein
VYKDEDSPIIYDIDEERSLQHNRKPKVNDNKSVGRNRQYSGINLMRKYFYIVATFDSALNLPLVINNWIHTFYSIILF